MTKLHVQDRPDGKGKHYYFHCPACGNAHMYSVLVAGSTPNWTFNGDLDKPTFTPSLLMYFTDDKGGRITRCHLFVTNGQIHYCGDCPHKYAGQIIDMVDWNL